MRVAAACGSDRGCANAIESMWMHVQPVPVEAVERIADA